MKNHLSLIVRYWVHVIHPPKERAIYSYLKYHITWVTLKVVDTHSNWWQMNPFTEVFTTTGPWQDISRFHEPLARYVKLRFAKCTGTAGKVFPPPRVSHPGMHRGTCVTAITAVQHVPWCMPGSLTNGFLWSRWRGKRSRHSRCMRNPQFNVSGQNPCCISTHRRNFENLIKANVVYTQTNSGCLFIYRVKQT